VKPQLKTVLSVVVFVMAAGLTYVGVTHWPRAQPPPTKADDTIAGIDGLVEGEVVALPQLKTIKGEPAALDGVNSQKFLFVFFTPTCAGCSVDAGLWKSLKAEAATKSHAFYLIDVGHDRVALDKFVEAYDLRSVPVLVSEGRSVAQTMKVNIVPQYLLIAKDGKVLHRWDGVRRYEQPPGPEELAKFFQ
jgi:peroxiredoxin